MPIGLDAILGLAGPLLGIAGNIAGGEQQTQQNAQASQISQEQLQAVLAQLSKNNELRDFLLQDALAQRGQDRSTQLASRETPESVTSFDPERGFVTELKPLPQAVYNGVLNRNLVDLNNNKFNDEQLGDIAAQRRGFRRAADTQLDELTAGRPITDDYLSGLLLKQARLGVDDSFRNAGNIASRQFARSGGPDSLAAGKAFDDMARSRSSALAQALVGAKIQGNTTAFDQEQARKSNAATNAFNLGNVGQQLLNIPGVSTNIGAGAAGTQQNIASGALSAGQLDVNRLGLGSSPIYPYGVVEGGQAVGDALQRPTSNTPGLFANIGDFVDLAAGAFGGSGSGTPKANSVATSTPRQLRNTGANLPASAFAF